MNRKQALRNLEEAVNLLREVEEAVRDAKLESGLDFENDFTEAVNEIERLQADLTEDGSES
jgi:methylphosphotriester-DNA--protein-cysteine methyltransferase